MHAFFRWTITGDEKWVWYDNSKAVRHWRLCGNAEGPKIQVPKPSIHSRKTMLIVFWDMLGIVHREFLPQGLTITADYYCRVLDRLDAAITKYRPFLSQNKNSICLQHDNAKPHTANLTKLKLYDLGWEVLPHPPYSPDLAPSDYHLFRALALKLKNFVFTSLNEVINFVDEFFIEKENLGTFFSNGILKLPVLWEGCIQANGNYFYKL